MVLSLVEGNKRVKKRSREDSELGGLKNGYWVLILQTQEWTKNKGLVLGLTQENSIENSIQDYLPYIHKTTSPYFVTLAYPK